ncbi:MAG: helix-turn-helix transcriptional regulator [Lachnospiraceae bacterium]|nr:helix-turn-helix transcriptional regulator [Lachnospiraceae bacterium]
MSHVHINDHSLHEDIKHSTNTAPYSVHFTDIPGHIHPALYLHWHDEMEFLYLTKGQLLFHIEDRTFLLQEKEGIFIPPGLLHMGEHVNNGDCSFYAFVLSPELLFSVFDADRFYMYVQPILHNNISMILHLDGTTDWHQSILHYLQQLCDPSTNSELYIRGLTFLIWDLLYHNHLSEHGVSYTSAPQIQRLTATISFIQEHYQQTITLSQMSSIAHLSEGQLCRSFKVFTGMSPKQYLIRYRILQSCQLLLQTEESITDIALSCGFNNISYYNRAFFKIMNTTPGEYRTSNNTYNF